MLNNNLIRQTKMTTINANTRKGAEMIERYNESNMFRLSNAYGRYSTAKARAERECLRRMEADGGYGYRVISANTFSFSAAWKTPAGLRVETGRSSYLVC